MLALNVDEPSRATNAAFAIGRLIEKDEGKRTLVTVCGQYKIVSYVFIEKTFQFNLLFYSVRCLIEHA